jgi:hypothetical protein
LFGVTAMSARTLSVPQVILLIVVVVVLVFGVTYATLYLPALSSPGLPRDPGPPPLQLVFDETGDTTKPGDPPKVEEMEMGPDGFRAFWFRNPGGDPVAVRLEQRGCSCRKVEVCVLPAEWASLATAELNSRAGDDALQWQEIDQTRAVVVPPQARGGVRLHWRPEPQASAQRKVFRAELRTESNGVAGGRIPLVVEIAFVDPIRVNLESELRAQPLEEHEAKNLDVDPSRPEAKTKFLLWSSTRDQLTLTLGQPAVPEPCITWGQPERLSDAECAALAQRSGLNVRCAYRLTVTVRERLPDGKQLDLGAYRRAITVASDTGMDPIPLRVSGFVRGEVVVGSGGSKDRIDVDATVGVPQTREVFLISRVANLDLALAVEGEDKLPDYLKARLEPAGEVEGLKSWKLSVTVQADKPIDLTRERMAVVLRTNGTPPRKLRIPVTGNVHR